MAFYSQVQSVAASQGLGHHGPLLDDPRRQRWAIYYLARSPPLSRRRARRLPISRRPDDLLASRFRLADARYILTDNPPHWRPHPLWMSGPIYVALKPGPATFAPIRRPPEASAHRGKKGRRSAPPSSALARWPDAVINSPAPPGRRPVSSARQHLDKSSSWHSGQSVRSRGELGHGPAWSRVEAPLPARAVPIPPDRQDGRHSRLARRQPRGPARRPHRPEAHTIGQQLGRSDAVPSNSRFLDDLATPATMADWVRQDAARLVSRSTRSCCLICIASLCSVVNNGVSVESSPRRRP